MGSTLSAVVMLLAITNMPASARSESEGDAFRLRHVRCFSTSELTALINSAGRALVRGRSLCFVQAQLPAPTIHSQLLN